MTKTFTHNSAVAQLSPDTKHIELTGADLVVAFGGKLLEFKDVPEVPESAKLKIENKYDVFDDIINGKAVRWRFDKAGRLLRFLIYKTGDTPSGQFLTEAAYERTL